MKVDPHTVREYQPLGFADLLERRHESTLWTRFATCALGLWLFANVFTFQAERLLFMANDAVCGLLLVLFGIYSLQERTRWAPWAACLVGIWLEIMPLIFHAASSYAYLNDTLVGILAISLSVLIPGSPGVIEFGPEIPDGWSYNPSSLSQRLPTAFLALFAWLIARFMAAYQLGYIHTITDPLFHEGTMRVITSSFSKAIPISDAGIAAFVFTMEALLACKGGSRRWHSMPWIVLLFGLLVVPLGLLCILFIMMQPLLVGSLCFWCMLTALFMLLMVLFAIDEVLATLQFLIQAKKSGKPFWKSFWHGSKAHGGHVDTQATAVVRDPMALLSAMRWGISLPWNLVSQALVAFWLLVTGPVMHSSHAWLLGYHLVCSLIFLVSIVSMAEVVRPLRYLNILLGLVVAVGPWFLGVQELSAAWNSTICGTLIILLSIPKGHMRHNYGMLNKLK